MTAEVLVNLLCLPILTVVLLSGLLFLDFLVALDSQVCCQTFQPKLKSEYLIVISKNAEKHVPNPSSSHPYIHTLRIYRYPLSGFPFQTAVQVCDPQKNAWNHVFPLQLLAVIGVESSCMRSPISAS